jgi:hypothetical protein
MPAEARRQWPDAREVAAGLAAHIEALAADLLPAGKRKGHYWVCGGTGGEAGGSLFIHLTGSKRGHWQDAATGEFGDALDLIAACAFGGDKKAACAEGLRRLGLAGVKGGPPPSRPARQDPPPATEDPASANNAAAMRMWLEAKPSIIDTPVENYLKNRNIDLRSLGRAPRALRFHPALWHSGVKMRLPAMVAAITDGSGRHVATHRTWLEYAGGGWMKARIPDNKMVLGAFPGGSIRLWRGASGKSLKDAPAGDPVVITEGIESGLSIVAACPELRVLAAVSQGNLGGVELPPQIGVVILAIDNDRKPQAQAAAARVVNRWLDRGYRNVRIARSPFGNDFNDALQGVA